MEGKAIRRSGWFQHTAKHSQAYFDYDGAHGLGITSIIVSNDYGIAGAVYGIPTLPEWPGMISCLQDMLCDEE
jgi:hypothetical protein